MAEKKEIQKNLQEIKEIMENIKSRSKELTLVLPLKSGKNIKKDLYKINVILDQMLEKDKNNNP